ncbi:formate dehydrogenase accessory sulfurtransferase FdhD [Alicyclobacillus macrosporangiidus]|uniref:formate dehydrogenase accessory sulfurtransferase FdhD n=1 Tax=Alicyclobacillus macrosporangiidus TaxID=392015 RepID=UPI0006911734|nr:formate dehydrogenase accessory sulfurtransferase FdhD [Alicyclobacillus macrosporangiidus]
MSTPSPGAGEGLPLHTRRRILHYDGGSFSVREDEVATEYALTVFVNDQEMATVVCTPEYMEDLVIGFLASEGVIRHMGQVQDLVISRFRGTARVRTSTDVNFNQAFYNKRYIASCCGKGRQMFYYYNDAHTAKRVDDPVRVQPSQVLTLMQELEASAGLWHVTGGVHAAGLCTPERLELSRVDIGRHNALDKLYGHVFRCGRDVAGRLVAFSGRLSSEVLLKVAKMGAGIVIAKSAPTALALDIAEALNITTIGFARGQAFHVYTHPWRVEGSLGT